MGEFASIARSLAEVTKSKSLKGDRIRPEQIAEIISSVSGDESFNCYPGTPGAQCFHKAYFVSLSSRRNGRGHLSFAKALELFVQHMQDPCKSITKVAVIISDSWNDEVFHEWQYIIEQVKNDAYIEAYLITGGVETQVTI